MQTEPATDARPAVQSDDKIRAEIVNLNAEMERLGKKIQARLAELDCRSKATLEELPLKLAITHSGAESAR